MTSTTSCERTKLLIMGAAGFDYHVFNTVFRNDQSVEVVAFSFCGEQNVGTTSGDDLCTRRYPADLAGSKLYPEGIPFIPESQLSEFIATNGVKRVVFAYSDISHEDVMHRACLVLTSGSNFELIAPARVQLWSSKPVLAICATRTGVGKSAVSRFAVRHLRDKFGVKVVAVREPMPYSPNLLTQACKRFATQEDLVGCTVEEREEYEPYVDAGLVVYSGVDYAQVLAAVESEADVVVWDGGNNEVSFFAPDLLLVLSDPLRAGCEAKYYPGEVNVRCADVFGVTKCHEASAEAIASTEAALTALAKPSARGRAILHLGSAPRFAHPEEDWALVKDKRVVVVDDGPTLTHGNAAFGAGYSLARARGLNVVDARPGAVGSYREIFRSFPHLDGRAVPAMGYTLAQLDDLAATLRGSGAQVVVNGSPIDLASLLGSKLGELKVVRVKYDVQSSTTTATTENQEGVDLECVLEKFAVDQAGLKYI